jgi:hypothetical protein
MAIRAQLNKLKKRDLTITAFFNKAKGLADTLASIGLPLRDDEFTSFILNGLDKDYDSCFEDVNQRDDPMKPRDLYSRLLNTEQRIASRCSSEGYHEVYHGSSLANASSRGGGKSQYRPTPSASVGGKPSAPSPPSTGGRARTCCPFCGTKLPCQLCGLDGHLASRCHRHFKQDFLGIGNNGKGNERQVSMRLLWDTLCPILLMFLGI